MDGNKVIELDEYRRLAHDRDKGSPTPPAKKARLKREESRKVLRKKDWVFRGFSNPAPFLSEMMNSVETPEPLPIDEKLLQPGVLAYQRRKKQEPRILLISKKRSKKWGIPKGKVEPYLGFGESAAKEAFEEAGVLGYISPHSVGVFRANKRTLDTRSQQQTIEVWIYLLEVTEVLPDWPEKNKRQTKWVSCEMAARYLREPALAHLCQRLARS